MFDSFWKQVPPAAQSVSVWTYRLLVILGLLILLVFFSSSDGGFCTNTAAIAIGKDEALGCFEYWLNRYQGLLGGILALVGAALAFVAVRAQIGQTERHAQERRTRASNAARSILPPALSSITDYASQCIEQLKLLRASKSIQAKDLRFPSLPAHTIDVFKQAVEFADEKNADEFADLIAHIQVQNARLRDLINESRKRTIHPMSYQVTNTMYDAVDLHARAGRLFDYARRFMDDRLVRYEDFSNSMTNHELRGDKWKFDDRIVATPKLKR